MLTIIDEYSRKCLAITVERKLSSNDIIATLTELFIQHGSPEHIRSDNGPEFWAKTVKNWLKQLEVKTLFIEPGSPWKNDYIESFNGELRDELLNLEIFSTLQEAKRSSRTGDGTTTASGHTARLATAHLLPKLSSSLPHQTRSLYLSAANVLTFIVDRLTALPHFW